MKPYIYKIFGNGMTYYGSSRQPICERKATHLTTYRYYKKTNDNSKCCKSYLIFDSCDDWIMEIVEELDETITNEELLLKENYYILNYDCINKQLAIRTDEMNKEYQRKWAENKRRENGIQKREKIKTENEKEYKRLKQAEYRAKMTEEEKEEYNKARREEYVNRERTEEQKEKARERARIQREKIKSNEDELERMRAYKREKTREYRKQGKDTYYEDNKEEILKKRKEEYDANKEEINAKRREAYRLKKLEKLENKK
jgi:hypothetical protein